MDMPQSQPSGTYTVLVTGANAGLGFATCCRLIDHFGATRPPTDTLHLIYTTRDQPKSNATFSRLNDHIKRSHKAPPKVRVRLQGELLDLLSLTSVKKLAHRLTATPRLHIDALVLNAGIGGWSGIDWLRAIWSVTTDLVDATTWPTFKVGYTGRLASQHFYKADSHRLLGETFTANVFGHYMLAHMLVPVLSSTSDSGRIIWISSVEAQAHSFDMTDLQALTSNASYESSKRLTDLIVLTSELPSSRPYVDTFLSTSHQSVPPSARVKMHVCHPGVCATSIASLPLLLHYAMICAFYLARWLGSPWHPINSYLGAVAGVWLALAPVSVLDSLERDGKSKWGSSTDRLGNERVLRTDVAGWGWCGVVGDAADGTMKIARGRHKTARDLTARDRDEFVDLGRQCWKEMEELRRFWEARLDHV